MSDIQIAVGASDQASKILQNVERQTAMLAGGINKMASQTVSSTQRMEVAFKGLAAAAGIVTVIIGAVKAVGAVFNAGGAAMEAFMVQDGAVRGLTNALEQQGVEASKSIAKHQEFAAKLQNTTNVGDEFTLGLMKQAANLGIADDQLQETAKAAIGLAEATGMNATESLKKLNQAINGNASAFAEVIPQMKTAKTEEEKLALINDLATKGLLQKQDATQSLQGSSERMGGALGDLMEKIGALLAPIQTVVNNGFAVLFETMQSAVEPAIVSLNAAMDAMQPIVTAVMEVFQRAGVVVWASIESIVGIVETLANAMGGSASTAESWGDTITKMADWVAQAMIGFATMIEVALTNLPAVLVYIADGAKLHLERMRADFEHIFTVAIPAYLTWLAAEWPRLIEDAATAVMTIVTNMVSKVTESFSAAQEYLASEKTAKDFAKVLETVARVSSGGLLDGFEATTAALPVVAERAATATEMVLSAKMNAIGVDLATQFADKYTERIAKLGTSAKDKIKDLTVNLGQSAGVKGLEGKLTELRATESRLLTRGRGDDPTMRVIENTAETNTKLAKMPADLAAAIASVLPGLGKLLQIEVLNG